MGDMNTSMIVTADSVPSDTPAEITSSEFANMLLEIQEQPAWRKNADIEADYYDGNQLDSATLQAMKDLGMAPIVENLIGPTIDSVLGLEAKTRLDWKVAAQGDERFAEVAEAMNFKIKEAETEAHADRACSDAFAGQVKTGVGWVEVARDGDPFRYPYRVDYVQRNEIFWDFRGKRPDTTDWRYLVRKRWYDADVLSLVFKDKAELLKSSSGGWSAYDPTMMIDGGRSTGLSMDYARERGWTVEEQEWRDTYRQRLCLAEVWYRRWLRGFVLKTPDGRVIEFDRKNGQHVEAIAYGLVQPRAAVFSKVRLAWFVGPHKLADMASPYKHDKFPYVPFFGKREDMTGVPYGLVRPMKPLQEEINARNTKQTWLLAAKRITMTEGVTKDAPEVVRGEAARPDAMHVLNAQKLQQGGMFKVETDFQLNEQQYQALQDKRQALKNVAGVYASFEGNNKSTISGIAANTLVEQSTQTLAEIIDNFQFARRQVGELLLSMVIEDIGDQQTEVQIDNEINGSKLIVLNKPEQHPSGETLLDNDLQRARLRVALSDVPSTSSYRSQRLLMLTEITKSLPPQLQGLVIDFVMAATDLPERAEIVKRLRKALNLGDKQEPKNEQEAAAMQAEQQAAAQAQALQQRAVELDLADREAKIDKTKAETERLLNEIRTAQAETPVDNSAETAAISEQIQATQEHFIEQIDALRQKLEAATQQANDARITADADVETARIERERDIEVARINAHANDVSERFIKELTTLKQELSDLAAKMCEPKEEAEKEPKEPKETAAPAQPINLTVMVDASKPVKKSGTIIPDGKGGFKVESSEKEAKEDLDSKE